MSFRTMHSERIGRDMVAKGSVYLMQTAMEVSR